MEMFEEEVIKSASDKPSLWVRYVDDTFVIWPHGDSKLQTFLAHLNDRQDSIKFTMEKEETGSIPFFVSKSGKKFTTSVYRKKTHTDRYINYQPLKTGTISCLRNRAERVCNKESLEEERKHLQEVFRSQWISTNPSKEDPLQAFKTSGPKRGDITRHPMPSLHQRPQ